MADRELRKELTRQALEDWPERPRLNQRARRIPFPDLPNLAPIIPVGGDAGTTSFLGKVVSGGGNKYTVTIYDNGPDADSSIGDVTVFIPQIAAEEVIPPGTWLSAIMQFTDNDGNDVYYCQPPVWLD